jgi:hypothetical protein
MSNLYYVMMESLFGIFSEHCRIETKGTSCSELFVVGAIIREGYHIVHIIGLDE